METNLPVLRGLARFLLFGFLGLLIEVFFTGTATLVVDHDLRATSQTYLWMLPVYGIGGLLLSAVTRGLVARWPLRAFALVPCIYGVEYVTGATLRFLTGRCPWRYPAGRWVLDGLVRLDYFPFWLGLAALFPIVERWVSRLVEALCSEGTLPPGM